ncbi:MAG: Unknown protein [uncultured Sulfurovum sp.]|uniref:Heavy metal RND efflux outer membrane protein, CzcC family n=1 Tax=uncultured Sulfurovum sp. TaxID=269237 RepID=A0A6S6SG61_9BACT|nr:MAG: Unknown protein [uncultured Sulfurovum sp.]
MMIGIFMKYLLMIPLLFGILYAVNLNDILDNATQKNLMNQAIEKEGRALASKNLADTQTNPLTYNQSLARANGIGISGYEHEVSLSKEFKLGNIQSLEQKQNRLNNEAHLIEQEKYLVSFDNRLKNLYHQYCLDVKYVRSFQESYNNMTKLYVKKKKAFKYGEIAKTELLQLKFEKNRLKISLDNLSREEESSRVQLLSLTTLDNNEMLSCQDTYPIVQELSLETDSFQISQKAHDKRIESTQVGLKRYAKKLESIEVSMAYSKELETDIYTLGVSIPLNLSSNKSQNERAALMYQSSALALQNEQNIADKKYETELLKSRLSRNFRSIVAQEQNIDEYKNNLLPLMKKSYDYAESSVLEYLLSQHKLHTLQQELLEKQKTYYATLFQLYSISEIKETR